MTAAERLTLALVSMADQGRRPRCAEPADHHLWTSEDVDERSHAATLCRGCPVLTECGDAGAEFRALYVWGGLDRSPSPKRKAS